MKPVFRILFWLLAVPLLILLSFGYVRFGSLSEAWSFYKGNRVCLTPNIISLAQFDTSSSSSAASVSCVVKNLGFADVQLYGTTACCGIELVDGLPATLRPLESKEIKFQVHASPGMRKVAVFTTSPENPALTFSVVTTK